MAVRGPVLHSVRVWGDHDTWDLITARAGVFIPDYEDDRVSGLVSRGGHDCRNIALQEIVPVRDGPVVHIVDYVRRHEGKSRAEVRRGSERHIVVAAVGP